MALASPRALWVPSDPTLSVGIGMSQVIDGTGRAGEMQHVIHGAVDLDRLGDIMLDETKSGQVHQMLDIAAAPGQQVIDADHIVAVGEEPLAKV